MQKKSAGILLYRQTNNLLEVFLVHLGGPFFAKKDDGSWSIPKGEFDDSEEPLAAAKREFFEETGFVINGGTYIPLTPFTTPSKRLVYAFALEGDADPATLVSNTFEIEWPPRSGNRQAFPEVDRGEWFSITDARRKLQPAQVPLLDELVACI